MLLLIKARRIIHSDSHIAAIFARYTTTIASSDRETLLFDLFYTLLKPRERGIHVD